MSERTDAIRLANKILDTPHKDPDDNESVLARQFLRSIEIIDKMHADLQASIDPMGDLIQSNRDEILRKHEEAIRRIRKHLLNNDIPRCMLVLESLNLFHPMHADTWKG